MPGPRPTCAGYLPASLHRLATTRSGRALHTAGGPEGPGGGASGTQHHGVRRGGSSPSSGISTGCPSTTPVGLALGPDLPRADWLDPGTLGYSADGFLARHSLLALHSPTRVASTAGSLRRFLATRRSPTHQHAWTTNPQVWCRAMCQCHSFGGVLEPRYIVGAESLDQ